jgi:hypothetical protein
MQADLIGQRAEEQRHRQMKTAAAEAARAWSSMRNSVAADGTNRRGLTLRGTAFGVA